MWEITKEFDFSYGHRVWSQQLDKELSVNSPCKCRHLHGHQGSIMVTLKGSKLVDGMLTDFTNLAWFKKFVDENLDHRFIIDEHDPLFNSIVEDPLKPYYKMKVVDIKTTTISKSISYGDLEFKTIGTTKTISMPAEIRELAESFVIINFVPTSENLAKWLFDVVQSKMGHLEGVVVQSVRFFETPKSNSIYMRLP